MEERRGFGPRRGTFRGQREGRFAPKPVEVGKEYDAEIQEISRRGEGIARIQGLVIFVPNTKQGDHIKIKITKISRRFAEAEIAQKGESAGEVEKEE